MDSSGSLMSATFLVSANVRLADSKIINAIKNFTLGILFKHYGIAALYFCRGICTGSIAFSAMVGLDSCLVANLT